ncbi:MAG: hypothetical protein ACOY9J_11660 [Pseudomonadota bacterium]
MANSHSVFSALKPQVATFKTDKSVYEAERSLARNLSSLLSGSLTSERFVGHAKRGSVVIYRYSPFKRFGGIPGTMRFCGAVTERNGEVRLDGKFRLSVFGYMFLVLWMSVVFVASGWIFSRLFTSPNLSPSVAEDAVIAAIVLVVGLLFIYADLERLQGDVKRISELIEESLKERTPAGNAVTS